LFATSAAQTIVWCASMSAMQGMPMPGDWTMSMVWMRMPGQTWIEAAASFLAMWVVMLAAMLLPSQVPMLWRYRQAVRGRDTPRRGCTLPADARTAWRLGMRFGLHCSLSCANLTSILLVMGVMDLRAMALVTAAITAERLAPAGERIAQATGAVVIAAGWLL